MGPVFGSFQKASSLVAVTAMTIVAARAQEGTNPWDSEFSLSNNTSSTSDIMTDVGRSTFGIVQWLASGGIGIMVVLLIIYSGFMFSQGNVRNGLFGIGGIVLVALLLGLVRNFIFT